MFQILKKSQIFAVLVKNLRFKIPFVHSWVTNYD